MKGLSPKGFTEMVGSGGKKLKEGILGHAGFPEGRQCSREQKEKLFEQEIFRWEKESGSKNNGYTYCEMNTDREREEGRKGEKREGDRERGKRDRDREKGRETEGEEGREKGREGERGEREKEEDTEGGRDGGSQREGKGREIEKETEGRETERKGGRQGEGKQRGEGDTGGGGEKTIKGFRRYGWGEAMPST